MKVAKLMTLDDFTFKKIKEMNINVSGLVSNLLDDWLRKISVNEKDKLNEEKKIIEEKIAKEKEFMMQREERLKKQKEELLSQLNDSNTWKEFVWSEQTTDQEIMELNLKLRALNFKVDFMTLKKLFKNEL